MVADRKIGIIYIKKRTPIGWTMLLFFLLPFLMGGLTELLGLPGFIRYVMDLILIALCVLILINRSLSVVNKVKPLLMVALVLFVYTLVTYLFNYQSLFYYIWGVRNNFRYYIAFMAFVMFVCEDEAERWLELVDIIFYINAALVFFQFFAFNVEGDFLGGIFGIVQQNNGYTIMLLLVVLARSLIKNFSAQENTFVCMLKCFLAMLVAALEEIKIFSVMFVALIIIICFITRPSRRKIVVVSLSVAIMMIGAFMLVYVYEEFEGYFSLSNLIEYATKRNYSTAKDINRISAIRVLAEEYIPKPHEQLFGLGLGNCDRSDVAIFNSVFYQQHSWLHYTWFSSAMMFLETGIIGLGIYLAFFVVVFFSARRELLRGEAKESYCRIAMVMSLMSIIIIFYNASMRIEAGYFAYFIFALPFLSRSNTDSNAKKPKLVD